MKRKHKIVLLIVGIFLTLSIIIAASYAYYIFSISQSGTNVVRSDCFEITYSDGNAINITDGIPLTDKEARDLTPYTFTITNICNSIMEYNVNIETLNTCTIDLNAVAVKLDKKAKKILGSVANNDSSIIVNKTTASSSKTIFGDYLKAGESKTHNLRLWVDESATIDQSANKSYSSKVVVSASLVPSYNEATLISGPLFNKTIKELAGDEPTESNLSNYDNDINSANPGDYPVDYNVFSGYVSDNAITSIEFSDSAPSSGDGAVVVSTNDSDVEVLAWFDTDTIYLYSTANKIFLNENSAYYFKGMYELTNLDLNRFDTSKSNNMSYMFAYIRGLTSLDLSNFDTSNVTNMSSMFTIPSLESLDLSSFDTSKVTDMSKMFTSCARLETLDLSSFDTSNVTTMKSMFQYDSGLKSLDLSSFNTSNVKDMSWMFNYLNSIQRFNLNNFNTSNVTNMESMFSSCSGISNIDLSSFDTSKVTNMSYMFANMYRIQVLDISSFDTSSATNMQYMFSSAQSLETIYVGDGWTTSQLDSSAYLGAASWYLVGGNGTAVSSGFNRDYERIDCAPSSPGYLTYKGSLGDTAAYCASQGY